VDRGLEQSHDDGVPVVRAPASAITGRQLGRSRLPDLYFDGFGGFAFDVDSKFVDDALRGQVGPDDDDKLSHHNSNSVTVGNIVGVRCGADQSHEFEVLKNSKSVGSPMGSSRLRCRIPKDAELLVLEANGDAKFFRVLTTWQEGEIEVTPQVGSEGTSGEFRVLSGGVLRMQENSDTRLWNINSLAALNGPGIVFVNRGESGSVVKRFEVDGRTPVGAILGTITSSPAPGGEGLKISAAPVRHNTFFGIYMEGSVDYPFILGADDSPTTIIEPQDDGTIAVQVDGEEITHRRPAYLAFDLAEDGFNIIRNGEYAQYPVRARDLISNVQLEGGKRVYIRNPSGVAKTVEMLVVNPISRGSAYELYVEDLAGASILLHLEGFLAGRTTSRYRFDGDETHLLTPPPSGLFKFEIVIENEFNLKVIPM